MHRCDNIGLVDSMPDLKSVVKECALELGFDLVRVTSAQEFAWDREVTLERLKDGLMDGLPWFNEDRVRSRNHSAKSSPIG